MKATRPSSGRLRNLTRLLSTLREAGVTEYECGNVKLKLGPAPRPAVAAGKTPDAPEPTPDEVFARAALKRAGLSEETARDLAASLGVDA